MNSFDPESSELYAGLCGGVFPDDSVDFGEGLTLSPTYANLMRSFMVAFRPSDPPNHYGEPWRAAEGGRSIQVGAELHVPMSYRPPKPYDRLNTPWWVAATLRLRTSLPIMVPLLSDTSFTEAARDREKRVRLLPVEVEFPRFAETSSELTRGDLEWAAAQWRNARGIGAGYLPFHLLFMAIDQSRFVPSPELGLVSLWGALENMFSPSPGELRFRVSSHIAAFLEPPGRGRAQLQKEVAKLYDARSKAAHGAAENSEGPFRESYELTRRIVIKILECGSAPTVEDLNAMLFGVGAAST